MATSTSPKAESFLLVRNIREGTVLGHSIRVANTSRSRRKGLLGSHGLKSGEGLWIVPCEGVHTFAMRFPLDIVYLDRRNHVRKIVTDLQPWRVSFSLMARSVLELPAGTISATRTRVGDQLAFDHQQSGT
jgi:uncharacterized membrane protein (UPF0127 family)